MNYVLLLPAAFLVVSVLMCIKAVKNGKKPRNAVITQLAAFAVVCLISFAVPMVASAATTDTATAAAAQSAATESAKGMGLLAAALATGLSGIGGGIAVGGAAPAAIGATSEDPKNFGKALIFVALGEGVALYGLLISILIFTKI